MATQIVARRKNREPFVELYPQYGYTHPFYLVRTLECKALQRLQGKYSCCRCIRQLRCHIWGINCQEVSKGYYPTL